MWRRSCARSRASRSTARSSSGTTSRRTTSRCRWRSGRWRGAACGTRRGPERSESWASSASSILHRCGESFYFLLVCTWRNENELWETVWAKDGDGDVFFRPWPIEGTHRPTFCVWELGRRVPRTSGVERIPALPARRRVAKSRTCGRPTRESCDGGVPTSLASCTSCGSGGEGPGTGRERCASRSCGPSTRAS